MKICAHMSTVRGKGVPYGIVIDHAATELTSSIASPTPFLTPSPLLSAIIVLVFAVTALIVFAF